MTQQYGSNAHLDYFEVNRHWCDTSERYAGGDALLTALQNDWEVEKVCYRQEHWQAGTRLITIYHFDLKNGGEQMHMPVITTPYIRRMIAEMGFEVRPYDDQVLQAREDRYEGSKK